MQLGHLQELQDNLREVEEETQSNFSQFEGNIHLLDSIPGLGTTAAYSILVEIGQDMSTFPMAQHICA